MTSDVAGLVDELRAAFRGPGLRDHSWRERAREVGNQLPVLAGIDDLDPPAAATRKLTEWIRDAVDDYGGDFETILCAVAGMDPSIRHHTLEAREDCLAGKLGISKRTVKRRLNEMLEQLARDRLADSGRADAARHRGYVVLRHQAILRMDLEVPQVTERQLIEVTGDKLDDIDRPVSVPHDAEPTGAFTCRVLAGGTLRRTDREPGELDLLHHHIEPSRVLRRGEQHRIEIQYGLALPGSLFAVDPHTRYDTAILEVRFHPRRQPKQVRRLVAATRWQAGEPLPFDPSGRYRVRCFGLRPGFIYGLRWDESGPATG